MKDVLDRINENFGSKKAVIKTAQEIEEDKIEMEFYAKTESIFEDEIVTDMLGKYNDFSDAKTRKTNFALFLKDCNELTKRKLIPENHILYMTDGHMKKLLEESNKLFSYVEEVQVKTPFDSTSRTDTQSYLNSRCIGARGGENKESTMINIKKRINKINLLENIARGQNINYSSNIKTPGELLEINNNGRKQIPQDKPNKSKAMNEDDYKKIYEYTMNKLEQDPASATETDVAFLLMGEFGLRPSSVLKLTTTDLMPKNGTIEVEIEDNKSKQMFVAKASYEEYDNFANRKLIGLIYERAMLLNADNLTSDGFIPVITCNEQNLHKEYHRLLKKVGIDSSKYDGCWKTLRHRYAQNTYDEIRGIMGERYGEDNQNLLRNKTIGELNYLMGHSAKKITTTMGYVKNIW